MTEKGIRTANLSKSRILHFAAHDFTRDQRGKIANAGLVVSPPNEAKSEDDGHLSSSEALEFNLHLAK